MLTSQLIKQLQGLLEKEGDLHVYIFRRIGYCEDSYEDGLIGDDLVIKEEEVDFYKQIVPKRIQIS